MLEVARLYLEREGYIVYSATTGREGLSLAATRQPALFVIDLMLPDTSGDAVLQEVRRRSTVPVLMLSGAAGADERVLGLSLGRTTTSTSRSARASSSRGSRRCCGAATARS